jgi:hypothetical protein
MYLSHETFVSTTPIYFGTQLEVLLIQHKVISFFSSSISKKKNVGITKSFLHQILFCGPEKNQSSAFIFTPCDPRIENATKFGA